MNPILPSATRFLERELQWLKQFISARISIYFQQKGAPATMDQYPPPDVTVETGFYAEFVKKHQLDRTQRLLLILAMAPHLRPQTLDMFCLKNKNLDRYYVEFGGVQVEGHGGFWPTLETVAFLLGSNDLEQRSALMQLFTQIRNNESALIQALDFSHIDDHGSAFNSQLKITENFLSRLFLGKAHSPAFNHNFPAQKITTALNWDDLVLPSDVLEEVEEIKTWIEHHQTLLEDWQLRDKIQPGFRSLFYGPSGTGKTLTATLLGKATQLPVYRVDLSMIVSKYIGETEKNLELVFKQAERNEWILFFDEADAIFGKRSQNKTSNDRYANQEVAFLLQRIENFPGVILLASNLRSNIDEAFSRRFQSVIHFPVPTLEQRYLLWQKAFSSQERVAPDIDFYEIAEEHEITGGAIVNVLRTSSLMALRQGAEHVTLIDIQQAVRREFRKTGHMA